MYVPSRARPFLLRLATGSRGDVRLRGFRGLYHTFACSGKMEGTPTMMMAESPLSVPNVPRRVTSVKQLLKFCALLLLAFIAASIAASCRSPGPEHGQTNSQDLIVAAASNLTDAFAE